MRKKTILRQKTVKKKRPGSFLRVWLLVRGLGSFSIKCSLFFIGLIGLSVMFLSAYQYILSSPYIRLEEVVIKGVEEDLKNEILKLSDLNSDMSLFAININELRRRLEKHAWIRSVELEKRFPHTLIIKAEKETPRALVSLEKIFYMNRRGELFTEVTHYDDMDFPVITGLNKDLRNREEKLKLAAHILDSLESETGPWSLKELSEIHLSKQGDVFLYSVSIPAVVSINGRKIEDKKGELSKIVKHLRQKGLIYTVKRIDLNYKSGAVVSFING